MNGARGEEDGLRALLAGREARAALQRRLLSRPGVACVCQVSLNIPGLPKRMEGDARALSQAEKALTGATGREATASASLINGAGAALLLVFPDVAPRRLKQIGVAVEESAAWCRVLDIDVITGEGSLSRRGLGLPPRLCLICGEEAKICARTGAHPTQDLRDAVSRFLSHSFSSDASTK